MSLEELQRENLDLRMKNIKLVNLLQQTTLVRMEIKPISEFRKKRMRFNYRIDSFFAKLGNRDQNKVHRLDLHEKRYDSEVFDYYLKLRQKQRCVCCDGRGYVESKFYDQFKPQDEIQSSESVSQEKEN